MKELMYVRPSYETRGDGGVRQFADAHRGIRMAVAIAEVLELPFTLVSRARDAIERLENSGDEDHRFTPSEVAALAEIVELVARSLDSALDEDNRPRGELGTLIRQEAEKPTEGDFDRVFELGEDGRVATIYPRMPIDAVQETLPVLADFMNHAAASGLPVDVVD